VATISLSEGVEYVVTPLLSAVGIVLLLLLEMSEVLVEPVVALTRRGGGRSRW
jgi:hypothetical protein